MIVMASDKDGEPKYITDVAPGAIFMAFDDICVKLQTNAADYIAVSLLSGRRYTKDVFYGINVTVRVLPIQFQKVEQ